MDNELLIAVREYLKALDKYEAVDCPGGHRYDKLKSAEERLRALSQSPAPKREQA